MKGLPFFPSTFAALLLALLCGRASLSAETTQPVALVPPAAVAHPLWLISTRNVTLQQPLEHQTDRLEYWRYDPDGQWRLASLEQFLRTDEPAVVTCFYVHPNRVDYQESFKRAGVVFDRLRRASPPGTRFRMVVLSWPSERRVLLPRPELQSKAYLSEIHGYYLAWLATRIDPEVPLSFFGYSYGPRMITAALHLMGGGSLYGRRLHQPIERRPIRAVLMVPGIDVHWLFPGQHHGQALSQVDQVLVLYNPRDFVLRQYPRLYGHGGVPALGTTGIPNAAKLGPYAPRVLQSNVEGSVGKAHHWRHYEGSLSIMGWVAPFLLGSIGK